MKPKRALVVDDEPALARLLARVLTAEGWEVTTASNGRAAIRVFKMGRFALMITGVDLGDIDGIMLAQDLNGLDPALTIAILSGNLEHLDRASAGFGAALDKPFNLDEVRAIARCV